MSYQVTNVRGLLSYEMSLIHTIGISKIYKSWIIWYRFGLVNDVMRDLIENFDYTPWENEDSVIGINGIPYRPWGFHLFPDTRLLSGELSNSLEGKFEWKGMFRYWKNICLSSEEFEIFSTDDMGLGVRARVQENNLPLPFIITLETSKTFSIANS